MQMLQVTPFLPVSGEAPLPEGKGGGKKDVADLFAALLGQKDFAQTTQKGTPDFSGQIAQAAPLAIKNPPEGGVNDQVKDSLMADLINSSQLELTESTGGQDDQAPIIALPVGSGNDPKQEKAPVLETAAAEVDQAPVVESPMAPGAIVEAETMDFRGKTDATVKESVAVSAGMSRDNTDRENTPSLMAQVVVPEPADNPTHGRPDPHAAVVNQTAAAMAVPEKSSKSVSGSSDLTDRRFADLLVGGEVSPSKQGGEERVRPPVPADQVTAVYSKAEAGPTTNSGQQQTVPPLQAAADGFSTSHGAGENSPVLTAGANGLPTSTGAPAQAAPVPLLHLPSGHVVPESRVLEQVVGRLSLGNDGGARSLTMKLYPEELGEVRLNLIVEKDQVKAQLIAQSQQVQDVLEKHLPKLRTALEAQGLKLDSLQVSVDDKGEGGRGFFQQEHHRPSAPVRFAMKGDSFVEKDRESIRPPVSSGMRSGINVRI